MPVDRCQRSSGITALPNEAAAEQAIRQALQKKEDFNFTEVPLNKVIDSLREKMKVEIMLDRKALDDAGIQPDAPVTFSCHGISVRSAMGLIFRDLGLTWITRDEVLLVTTPEVAESQDMMQTRVYAVQDLIAPRPSYQFEGMCVPGVSSSGFPQASFPSSTVGDGQARGMGIDGMGGGRNGRGGNGYGRHGRGWNGRHGHGWNGRRLYEHGEYPQLGAQPANASGTPAKKGQASTPGKAAGGREKEPQASSPAAAGHARRGEGAHWSAGRKRPRAASSHPSLSINALIDVITSVIRPDSWASAGGPAPDPVPAAGTLVITQTEQVHQQIERLLDSLRASTPGLRVVTILRHLAYARSEQLNQLFDSKSKEGGIDRKALEELAAKAPGYVVRSRASADRLCISLPRRVARQ